MGFLSRLTGLKDFYLKTTGVGAAYEMFKGATRPIASGILATKPYRSLAEGEGFKPTTLGEKFLFGNEPITPATQSWGAQKAKQYGITNPTLAKGIGVGLTGFGLAMNVMPVGGGEGKALREVGKIATASKDIGEISKALKATNMIEKKAILPAAEELINMSDKTDVNRFIAEVATKFPAPNIAKNIGEKVLLNDNKRIYTKVPANELDKFIEESAKVPQEGPKITHLVDINKIPPGTTEVGRNEFLKYTPKFREELGKTRISHYQDIMQPVYDQDKISGLMQGKKLIPGKYAGGINLERLNTTPEGKQALAKAADLLEQASGKPVTHEQVIKAAREASVLEGSLTRKQQVDSMASMLKSKQQLTDLSDQVGKAGQNASPDLLMQWVDSLETTGSHATALGRGLEAQKIKATALGVDTTLDKNKVVKELLRLGNKKDEIVKAAKGVDWANSKAVTEFYRKFIKPSLGEKLTSFRYINMLTNIGTQAINILSTGAQFPLKVATKLAHGPIDVIGSTLAGKTRTSYTREVTPYAKGYINSLFSGEAWSNWGKAIKGTISIARPDISKIPPTTKGPLHAMSFALRFMEGADVFFKTAFKSAEKEALAYRYARKGLKTPTVAVEAESTARALETIFRQPLGAKDQGHLLKFIDGVTKGVYRLRNVKLGGTQPLSWIVPFVQTPMNILKQGIEFSPTGLATIPGAANKGEQLAKALVGSTVFAGAGALAFNDKTTWSAPIGKNEKEAFYASGRKAYSLKVGDKWISYSRLGPLAYPIAMAAALREYSKDNGLPYSTSERFAGYIGGMSKFFSDQSYVQGIGNLIEAAQSETGRASAALTSLLANLGRQVIPLGSLVSAVSRTIDDTYRNPKGYIQSMEATLPILSKKVPAYTTPFGEPSKRQYPVLSNILPYGVSKESPVGEQYYQGYTQELKAKREARTLQEEFGSSETTGGGGSMKRMMGR